MSPILHSTKRSSRSVGLVFGFCASFVLAMMACGSIGEHVYGQTWFVDNVSGQDSNTGRSPEVGPLQAGPFRSITRALQVAQRGDTIVLSKTDTPYAESITLSGPRHSGFQGSPFRLVGSGATLVGTQEILPQQWEVLGPDLFAVRPADGAFQQLYLGDRPATFQAVTKDQWRELEPLSWTLLHGHIIFRVEEGRLPQDYRLAYSGQSTGITLYNVEHVTVENLTVQGFWLDGVNAHDNVRDAKLVGVTARGNGRSGISVGGSSHLDAVSCLIGDNLQHQVRTETVARLRLMGSNVLPNSQGAPQYRDGGTIVEAEPVVNTTVKRRLPASPERTSRLPGKPIEGGAARRNAQRLDELPIYR